MPTYTVDMGQGTNNAWAEGASALAKALTPDYKSKAEADLMGVRADQSRASANASNASAAKYNADRDKTLAETTGINWEQGVRENLFSQFQNGDLTREDMVELAAEAGIALDPTAALGDLGSINNVLAANAPGATPADMTMPMLGAGTAYGSTPGGFNIAQQGLTDRNVADNLAAGERNDATVTGAMNRSVFETGADNIASGQRNDADNLAAAELAGAELVPVYNSVTKQIELVPASEAVGRVPAMTKTEAEGVALQTLPLETQQDMAQERTAGDYKTVERTHPDGTKETLTVPGEQINTSTDKLISTTTVKPDNYVADGVNYLSVDGVTDVHGNLVPENAVKVGVQAGSMEDAGFEGTEGEARRLMFVARMTGAEKGIQKSMATMGGQPPDLISFALAAPKDTMMGQLLANQLVADDAKAFMTSAQQFLTAILRLDSGAAVPITEYPMYYAQFIPMPGDGPDTLERKKLGRDIATASLKEGLGADEILDKIQYEVGILEPTGALQQASARQTAELKKLGYTLSPEGGWIGPDGQLADLSSPTSSGGGAPEVVWVRGPDGKLKKQ